MNVSANDYGDLLPPEWNFVELFLGAPGVREALLYCKKCSVVNYKQYFCNTHFKLYLEMRVKNYVGEFVNWDDNRLLYQYRNVDKIQIGEYLFEKQEINTKIEPGPYIQGMESGKGYYFIPFFIYKGDLYFEVRQGDANTFFAVQGYHIWKGSTSPSWNYIANVSINAGSSFSLGWGPYSSVWILERELFGQSGLFHTMSGVNTSGGDTVSGYQGTAHGDRNGAMWYNASQRQRNRSLPVNATAGVYVTSEQIIEGDSPEYVAANRHNFTPDQLGTGIIKVPPEFEIVSGKSFHNYLNGLTASQQLYNDEVIEEREFDFPGMITSVLEQLEDDDQVEITVNDDGTVTIVIVKGGAGGDDTPGTGDGGGNGTGNGNSGTTAPSGFWNSVLSMLNRIIKLLEDIERNTAELFNFDDDWAGGEAGGTAKKPFWRRIVDGVGNAVGSVFETGGNVVGSIAEGVGNGLGSVFGGTGELVEGISNGVGNVLDGIFGGDGTGLIGAILDLIKAIIELPVKILNTLGLDKLIGGIPGMLTDILGFLNGLVKTLTDLFTKLIIPSEGFFENSFDNLQNQFEVKLPVINQSKGIYDDFIGMLGDTPEKAPELKLQGELFGAEINQSVIDFSWFEQYRGWFHGIIIAFAYIAFIRKLIKRIPKLIGGV